MKKFILVLTILTTLIFFLAANAFAGWTIDISMHAISNSCYRVTIVGVSDGSDPAAFSLNTSTLNTYLSDNSMNYLKGCYLYEVITDPGVAPDAVWTVAFDDGLGGSILDLSSLSVTVTEIHDASTDLGFYPAFTNNITVDFGDIGTAADSVTVYLILAK